VLDAWEAVLPQGSVDANSLESNFFDLGGHSLMVARAVKLINSKVWNGIAQILLRRHIPIHLGQCEHVM
jgi:hypothetical protein